jgi:hypothetical protein
VLLAEHGVTGLLVREDAAVEELAGMDAFTP